MADVVYGGRAAKDLDGAIEGAPLLDEWSVAPARLRPVLDDAATLIVIDPWSFPFEALTAADHDIPLVIFLPDEPAETIETVFGRPILQRLGFFDHIVTDDETAWTTLAARHGWAGSQLVRREGRDDATVVNDLLRHAAGDEPALGVRAADDPVGYWRARGASLAEIEQHRAVCSVHEGLRANKAMHRLQLTAMESRFAAARSGQPANVPMIVLEVGTGVGRWATTFLGSGDRFHGVDVSADAIAVARRNFPAFSFDVLEGTGDELRLPFSDEAFDLVFTATVLHHNPTSIKRRLLTDMWRVTRPGGSLIFLEDFVAGELTETSTVYPMSLTEFLSLALEATNGRIVLDHVESLRYGHDNFTRAGIVTLTKIAVPRTW